MSGPEHRLLKRFEAERAHLIGVAYRMLGSVQEAEDVVQNAWLKVAETTEEILDPRAYFTTVVVRLALDTLRSARVRREAYVGPWLPEPVVTQAGLFASPEPRDLSSISFAFLILMESLSPLERAAFLLHEVFDWTAPEIGGVLGREEAAVRQLIARARAHVSEGSPRFPPSNEAHQQLLSGFLATVASGDVNALAAMLADDAVVRSDGGGVVRAARKVVHGAVPCAKLLIGITRQQDPTVGLQMEEINGAPALVLRQQGQTVGVLSLTLDGERITAINLVVAPEKLRHLDRP